jgi:hypothetical protein
MIWEERFNEPSKELEKSRRIEEWGTLLDFLWEAKAPEKTQEQPKNLWEDQK